MNSDLQVLANAFKGVFDVASTDLHMFGVWISPLDFWLTTAIIYMLVDILMSYMGGDSGY